MKDFDELLDGVLREDGLAEPRVGLEGRVMARVRGKGISRLRDRWRGWLLVPTAVCLGIVTAVWYLAGGGVPQPDRVASRGSAPMLSAHSAEKPGVERPHSLAASDGGSGRALRDAHLSRDKTAAKTGHPVLVGYAAKPLPKLNVFPAPVVRDVFPRPLKADERDSQLAALRSQKVGEALVALHQEQNQPIRIAAIEITPIQTD